MTISEYVEPSMRTLAARRPGHSLMAHLVKQLHDRDLGDIVPADLESWHVGAIGEMLVGQELARLPEGWMVLHAIPCGRHADIDHLVIGPTGVFVINTKRHPRKRVRVGSHVVWIGGGAARDYQKNLLDRVQKVRALLRPVLGDRDVVRPLLVFVDSLAFSTTGDQAVAAVTMARLVEHLQAGDAVLPPGVVRAVFAKASQPSTWGCSADALAEADPTDRFLRLVTASSITTSTHSSVASWTDPRPVTDAHPMRRAVRSCPPAAPPRRVERAVDRLATAILAAALLPLAALLTPSVVIGVVHALVAP